MAKNSFLHHLADFRFALALSILVSGAVLYALGPVSLLPLLILVVIEILFSFDNAIINAKILKTLSPLWRQLFLTVGIIIAVFGMRLLFPIALVAVTAQTGFGETIHLALNEPTLYAHELEEAHPAISSFGGMFLLLLALSFFMLDEGRPLWLKRIERPLMRFGGHRMIILVTLAILALVTLLPINHHPIITLIAGASAIALFYAINALRSGIAKISENSSTKRSATVVTGWAAFFSFLYLEVLDASFSLDAVLGAFAVTNDVILIAAGLGIGAVWVRSLTVYMIKRGTLNSFVYLEHGAHYAILLLALSLIVSLFVEVPSAIIGVLGVLVIGASVMASRKVPQNAEA